MTIGDGDVDDDATLGRISGCAVDATGRAFIADVQQLQFRVVSPSGALVARVGRSGFVRWN